MESEERPSKLRKLDHDKQATSLVSDASAPTESPATTSEVANPPVHIHNSKSTTSPAPTSSEPPQPPRNLKDPTLHALSLSHPGLSKNQLKKLRRQQEWDAAAPARKQKRKDEIARKREAKRTQRAALLASGIDPSCLHKGSHRPRAVQLPICFLIDCGFDGLMSDSERVSLGAQVTRSYSANKHSLARVHLAISSWGGKLRERFEGVLQGHYKGWKGVKFEEAGFKEVGEMAREWMVGEEGGRLRGCFEKYLGLEDGENGEGVEEAKESAAQGEGSGEAENGMDEKKQKAEAAAKRKQLMKEREEAVVPGLQEEGEVIYLTSESPDTLTELKPYCTYIVGGLVDKNREKGICYKRAKEAGVKTARLPIGDYLEMTSRKVLATNHVVEIMLKWLEYEDWGKSFLEIIPKRKGGQLKKGEHKNDDNEDGDSDIEADDVDDIDPDLEELEAAEMNHHEENGTDATNGGVEEVIE
ncbi:tRNA (guanine(9)-N1)-methyltransferase-like protein [Elsinoe fawcettii]|nr:tRNA (guanine(9)-N1)-methyltransferase-like protein [Elsinoe fawcettii]